MEYLPAEIHLKIFKNLNFDELIKIKQTNKYFCEFINKYKDELARKRFERLQFKASNFLKDKKLVNTKFVRVVPKNFPLSKHLREKWRSALDKRIPVFIVNTANSDENDLLLFIIPEMLRENKLSLKLPLFPKNVKELKIIRYWLLKIFRCVFDFIDCYEFVFNPEMIKLLLNDEEINKLKFNCQWAHISLHLNIYATLDRLVINESLLIRETITEEDNDILLILLLNEGYRIPEVILHQLFDKIALYNNLINYIETSTDLTKMVVKITFYCGYKCWPISKLTVKGVEMKESNKTEKYFKITNNHNSKMMFSILWIFEKDDVNLIKYIEIVKI